MQGDGRVAQPSALGGEQRDRLGQGVVCTGEGPEGDGDGEIELLNAPLYELHVVGGQGEALAPAMSALEVELELELALPTAALTTAWRNAKHSEMNEAAAVSECAENSVDSAVAVVLFGGGA
jgi:hypothetical protein